MGMTFHPWQEYNEHGYLCHFPGCRMTQDEHGRQYEWTECNASTDYELIVHVEQGTPCVCLGDDIPHPPGLVPGVCRSVAG